MALYINACCEKCDALLSLQFDSESETFKDLLDAYELSGWSIKDRTAKPLIMHCPKHNNTL